MSRHLSRGNAALAIALLALFVAVGGPSYAAGVLAPNSVGSAQLKPGAVRTSDLGASSVTSGKIKNATITPADLAAGAVAGQPRLRPGQSMTGTYAATGSAFGDYAADAITFPDTLTAPIPENHLIFVAASKAPHCPGIGHAARGYMCFYENQTSNLSYYGAYGDGVGGAGLHGLTLFYDVSGSHGRVQGVWTVTAP